MVNRRGVVPAWLATACAGGSASAAYAAQALRNNLVAEALWEKWGLAGHRCCGCVQTGSGACLAGDGMRRGSASAAYAAQALRNNLVADGMWEKWGLAGHRCCGCVETGSGACLSGDGMRRWVGQCRLRGPGPT